MCGPLRGRARQFRGVTTPSAIAAGFAGGVSNYLALDGRLRSRRWRGSDRSTDGNSSSGSAAAQPRLLFYLFVVEAIGRDKSVVFSLAGWGYHDLCRRALVADATAVAVAAAEALCCCAFETVAAKSGKRRKRGKA